jgi:TonB family protein
MRRFQLVNAGLVAGGTLLGLPYPSLSAGHQDLQVSPDQPVRVGGRIKTPKRLKHVAPAIQVGVHGPDSIEVELIVSPDGTVASARPLRSPTPRDTAALSAVQGWRYAPTLVSGKAVPVVMRVKVRFPRDHGEPAADADRSGRWDTRDTCPQWLTFRNRACGSADFYALQRDAIAQWLRMREAIP